MSNLFKKAAVFSDIHYGLKSNSIQHNIDCVNFVVEHTCKAKCVDHAFLDQQLQTISHACDTRREVCGGASKTYCVRAGVT